MKCAPSGPTGGIRVYNFSVDDFKAAAAYYATQDIADTGRLGMTGFCFGGGITWRCATQMPELKAASPYYGPPPPLDAVPNIKAAESLLSGTVTCASGCCAAYRRSARVGAARDSTDGCPSIAVRANSASVK